MQRNKIFTFIFSLIPGAGHMYYGFYKQGIQLMCMFITIFAMSDFFNLDILLFALPVVWFFSFFHINNLSKLSAEELATYKDHWFMPEAIDLNTKRLHLKYSPAIAMLLLCFGIFLLLRNVVNIFSYLLPSPIDEILYTITWRSPQIFVSIIIIYAAIQMIRRKKKELELELDDEKYNQKQIELEE